MLSTNIKSCLILFKFRRFYLQVYKSAIFTLDLIFFILKYVNNSKFCIDLCNFLVDLDTFI